MNKKQTDKVKASLIFQQGNYSYNTGDFKDALKKYTVSINIIPNGEVYCQRGLANQALGNKENASKDFSTAIKLGNKQAVEYLRKLNKGTTSQKNTKSPIKMNRAIEKTAKKNTSSNSFLRDFMDLQAWENPASALLWKIITTLFWLAIFTWILTTLFHC